MHERTDNNRRPEAMPSCSEQATPSVLPSEFGVTSIWAWLPWVRPIVASRTAASTMQRAHRKRFHSQFVRLQGTKIMTRQAESRETKVMAKVPHLKRFRPNGERGAQLALLTVFLCSHQAWAFLGFYLGNRNPKGKDDRKAKKIVLGQNVR